MPDEDHAATVIVMLQVVAPGGPNVVVGEVVRRALFGETGDGELPVSRRKQQASTGKRRDLKERGPEFLLTAPPGVRVECLVLGNRRIDIEAVDRRIGIGLQRLDGERAVGIDDRRRKIAIADIGKIGPANPDAGSA